MRKISLSLEVASTCKRHTLQLFEADQSSVQHGTPWEIVLSVPQKALTVVVSFLNGEQPFWGSCRVLVLSKMGSQAEP